MERRRESYRTPACTWADAQTVDYDSAIRDRMAGWPSRRDLYGAEEPRSMLQHSAFSDLAFGNSLY